MAGHADGHLRTGRRIAETFVELARTLLRSILPVLTLIRFKGFAFYRLASSGVEFSAFDLIGIELFDSFGLDLSGNVLIEFILLAADRVQQAEDGHKCQQKQEVSHRISRTLEEDDVFHTRLYTRLYTR